MITTSKKEKIRVNPLKVNKVADNSIQRIDANLIFMKTLTYQMSSNRIPVYLRRCTNETYSSQFYFDDQKHKIAIIDLATIVAGAFSIKFKIASQIINGLVNSVALYSVNGFVKKIFVDSFNADFEPFEYHIYDSIIIQKCI